MREVAVSETGGSSFRAAPGVRPAPVVKPIDEKLRDASKMYEKLFLKEMVKAMRSTVQESGFLKQNAAEKIFRDELDQETVNSWAEQKGGVGLADLIYNNLIEKYGEQLGLKAPVTKPKGPIALNDKSDFAGVARLPSPRANEMNFRLDRQPGKGSPEVTAPWGGTLTGSRDLGEGTYLLEIAHDHGLKGRMVFRGTPDRLVLGQSVQEGERIGVLSPEARSVFWTLALEAASDAEKTGPAVSE